MTFRDALGEGAKSETCQPSDIFCRTLAGCVELADAQGSASPTKIPIF